MDGFKIFLLVLLSLLMIIGGWLYLAAMGVETTLLNTDYYRNIFRKTELPSLIYNEMEHILPEILHADMAAAENIEYTGEEGLIDDRMGIILRAFTTAYDSVWLEEQLIIIIDDLLATVKGEKSGVSAFIDFEKGREQFFTEINTELDKLPAETREMLDITDEEIAKLWGESGLPAQIMIGDLIEENIPNEELQRVISIQRLSRFLFFYLSYALFALFLLFFCLLAGVSGGFKWFGSSVLFFSSTFLVGLQILRLLLAEVAIANIPDYIAFSTAIFQTTINYTITRMSLVPLICLAVGLAFLIMGMIANKRTLKLKMAK